MKPYKKFKPQNQTQYLVTRYPNKGTAYKKRFRNSQLVKKRFDLFFGGFSKKFIKNQIRFVLKKSGRFLNINLLFLEHFETRLDTILYRSKFCNSIENARQLIIHGKILVNNRTITYKNYKLKPGDLIAINSQYIYLIEKNLKRAQTWPLPPKYLFINYKTMQIVLGNFKPINSSTGFTFNLQIEKIILNYIRY